MTEPLAKLAHEYQVRIVPSLDARRLAKRCQRLESLLRRARVHVAARGGALEAEGRISAAAIPLALVDEIVAELENGGISDAG